MGDGVGLVLVCQGDGFGLCPLNLVGGVVELIFKSCENPVSAFESGPGIAMWVEPGRGLGEGGEEGTFGEGKIGERFVKKEAGGFGASLTMGAVVEAIEIGGEDLVFTPAGFEAAGDHRFGDFFGEGAFLALGRNLDELLGDGGSSGNNLIRTKVVVEGTGGGGVVDTGVLEEAFVFGCESGLDEVIGNFFERSWLVAEVVLAGKVGEFLAMTVEENAVRGGWGLECLGKRTQEGKDRQEKQQRGKTGE